VLENLEAWQVIVSISSTLVGLGLTILGMAFHSWSKKLEGLSVRVDTRLSSMEEASHNRWKEVEAKMQRHDNRFHKLHIRMERRLSYMEAVSGIEPTPTVDSDDEYSERASETAVSVHAAGAGADHGDAQEGL